MLDDVVAWAAEDPNVRLVVVTGSFARGEHDELSDLDIELYVRDASLLLEETDWYQRLGDVLVVEALENPGWHPTRLVSFVDAKIDFMIAPMSALAEGAAYDGPFTVVLDKDGHGDRLEPVIGVSPPSAEQFRTCIEWFFAAALQYSKAVARDDPWPIKTRDADLKRLLLQMLEWDFGVRNGWSAYPPHNGSRVGSWTTPDLAAALGACWADFSTTASADALQESIGVFTVVTQRVADALGFDRQTGERAAAEVDRILGRRTASPSNT
jgi:predicted nucleotidyltransferase